MIVLILRVYCTPNQNCYVLYLKIINTFLKYDIYILKKILQGPQNGIENLMPFGTSGFKFWVKTVKILFWSITQEPLGLLKF